MTQTNDWYSPENATFGDRVADARAQSGVSQEQLALRLGIKLNTLKAWEDDISEPRGNKLSTLAGCLNVSIMWLLNGEGDGISPPEQSEENASENVRGILTEIRTLHNDICAHAERLCKLEQKLRYQIGS